MDFCSYLWWIFVSTCMSLQIWEQWFALWPRFPDRSKKAYWLFSSNFYLWLRLSGDFQAPCVVDWKPEAPLLTFLTWSVLSLLHFALLIWKCKLIVFKSSKAYLLSPTAIITPAFLHFSINILKNVLPLRYFLCLLIQYSSKMVCLSCNFSCLHYLFCRGMS